MNSGDLFFAYTDGAPEMNDPRWNFFGKERLLGLVESNAKSAPRLLEEINAQLFEHIGDGDQFDDITLMAVRRK
jgi:serine phosphatase RsbU (regulator of sigma subunit)